MRLFFALALSLCLAPLVGCGDDSGSNNMDLTVAADMSANGKNCLQIITCVMGCSGAMQATCAAGCAATGSTKAMGEYQAIIGCAYGICTLPGDGGVAACANTTDTSGGCVDCLVNAAQANMCATQLNACLSGT